MQQREASDLNVRKVLWTGISLLLLLAVIGIALFYRQQSLVRNFNQVEVAPKSTPRLQAEFESGELKQAIDKDQSERLHRLGWNDTQKVWAQVSFETAARLVLEKKTTAPQLLFSAAKKGANR